VAAALVPLLVVLAVVGFVGVRTYDSVARDVVTQRDAELARVTGERLSDHLAREATSLLELAADERIRSLDSAIVPPALEAADAQLTDTYGSIAVYDRDGALAGATDSLPVLSAPEFEEELTALRETALETQRPAYSNTFRDQASGEELLVVGVPVEALDADPGGMLVGLVTLRTSSLGDVFSTVLERNAGASSLAYVVDARGHVVYHRDAFRVGTDLSELEPIRLFLREGSGATISDDLLGEEVVAGYAPVPGTGWGVITQERWGLITAPIRQGAILLLALLAAGALISAALVAFAINRTLRPIGELVRGADRLADGDFDHRIDAGTDREFRALARQFNAMAEALKRSYTDLEQNVSDRTEEIQQLYTQAEQRANEIAAINLRTATVADVTAKVASILSIDELLPYVTNLLRESFAYDIAYIFLLDPASNELVMRASSQGDRRPPPDDYRIPMGQGVSGWVAEHAEPLLLNDAKEDVRSLFTLNMPHRVRVGSQLSVPIMVGDEVLGVLGVEQPDIGAFDETDQFTAQTIGHCLGVAVENARLFEHSGEAAVLEERNRLAREIHDTLAQGFTGIVLQLEAAEQVLEGGGDPATLGDHLDRARSLARESLNEARRSVWDLAPRALDAKPLSEVLDDEVRSFAADGAQSASFAATGTAIALAPPMEAALLRICQESLTNARRHARASNVSVELEFGADAVTLRVSDDGEGFDLTTAQESARARGGGFGISGMQQRTRLFGGRLAVTANEEGGTTVEASLPTRASQR
jgi:signal transduction histidine kinase